jgi:hypothetical protein
MGKVLVAIAVFAVFPLLLAQQTLNNDSVIKMVKMGFQDDTIISAINRSPGTYDTSVDGLNALKNAGVTSKVSGALVSKASVVTAPPVMQAKALAPVVTQQISSDASKRLYVEERIKTTSGTSVHCDGYGNCYGHNTSHSRNVSLEVTREVMKHCSEAITVTDNRDVANYVLRITPGASTLYKQDGDVAYVSPTRWKTSNLAKDLCDFVVAHH